MIILNICSPINISIRDLTQIFVQKQIKCQITKTTSSVPDQNGTYQIENGYRLLIFDVDGITFRDQIWYEIKARLKLRCAFVQYQNDYMGCIMNWPGVFTESRCHSCNS